jgi:NAD(P)-dependent dehydrogenase (short-subunit alcohol dehydrogenase family)
MSGDPAPTVLITGAAGHLGRALTDHFLAQGAQLVLLDRQAPTGGSAPLEPDSVLFSMADLLDREQVRRAVAQGEARFGKLDAVCHLAGGFAMGEAVHETSDRTWDHLMDLNARTLIHVAAAVVPLLERRGGSLVTVGASAAMHGAARQGAYSASKSALVRLTESMSDELKRRGVRVNCVLPSIIDTPDNRRAMPDADWTGWVAPQAIADVIGFLCSEAARAVHGACVPVSGLA